MCYARKRRTPKRFKQFAFSDLFEMINSKYWLLTTLILHAVLSSEANHGCDVLVGELANSNSKYLYCITRYGSPVKICEECVSLHKDVETKYENFLKGNDSSQTCPDMYIDKDKLNIIAHTHDIINNLWNEAYCKNCNNPDGTTSNETSQFMTLAVDYQSCEIREGDDVCTNCKKEYAAMNALFEIIKQEYKYQICFDIQDMMNRTRANWTKMCGHETPKGSLAAFAAVSSVLMSIPFLFYCGFFMYTRRQERDHHLILDEPSADQREDVRQSTSHNALINTPSTSSGIAENNVSSEDDIRSKTKLIELDEDVDMLS